MPWRVITARDRSQVSAALAHFPGQVFLPTHAGVDELNHQAEPQRNRELARDRKSRMSRSTEDDPSCTPVWA